jgi:hypothetical protein
MPLADSFFNAVLIFSLLSPVNMFHRCDEVAGLTTLPIKPFWAAYEQLLLHVVTIGRLV